MMLLVSAAVGFMIFPVYGKLLENSDGDHKPAWIFTAILFLLVALGHFS